MSQLNQLKLLGKIVHLLIRSFCSIYSQVASLIDYDSHRIIDDHFDNCQLVIYH